MNIHIRTTETEYNRVLRLARASGCKVETFADRSVVIRGASLYLSGDAHKYAHVAIHDPTYSRTLLRIEEKFAEKEIA